MSNWGLFWKSLVLFFRITYVLSVGFKIAPLGKSVFLCWDIKTTQILPENLLKAAIVYILSFDLLTFSNICTVTYVTVECVELNWLCNHVKKVRSRQASISINSCAELSKTQLFPVGIVNHFFVEMCEWWNYSKTTIYSLYSKIIYNNIWHNLY